MNYILTRLTNNLHLYEGIIGVIWNIV